MGGVGAWFFQIPALIRLLHSNHSVPSTCLRCAIDGVPTLKYKYKDSSIQRFSLRAFRFRKRREMVYLHCDTMACRKDDKDSRCTKGCTSTDQNDGGRERPLVQTSSLTIGPIRTNETQVLENDQRELI